MKRFLPSLAVISAAFLWSLDGFIRQELHTVPSMVIVTLENLFGGILFLPFLITRRNELKDFSGQRWASVFWVSIIGSIVATFFYTKALSYTNHIELSVVVLLQKLQPVFAITLAIIILKEPVTRIFLMIVFLALGGGYLVSFGSSGLPAADPQFSAAMFAILAAFAWGSSTVLGKHALQKISFPLLTALRLLIAGTGALLFLLITGTAGQILEISLKQLGLIFLIVFSTGSVALSIYYYGLKRLPATHASIYELFWPLSAVGIDWLIRGKFLDGFQILGGLMLFGSIILLTLRSRNRVE